MNYSEAINFIETLINYEKKFSEYKEENYNPEKITIALNSAEIDYSRTKIFHIAGTKGKGSTSIYLSRLIHKHTEENTGLYTSPHISKINERISINGVEISDDEFAALITEFEKEIISEKLTFFEALTFIAIIYFTRKNCKYIVLETGLGGRLDATNFCKPILSIITPISYDHTKILGNTLSKIAYEKAGIIKNLTPVISSKQKREALLVLKKVARKRKAGFFYFPEIANYRIKERTIEGALFDFSIKIPGERLKVNNIKLSTPSDEFVKNFLLAVLAFFIHFKKLNESILREVAEIKLPFRMKIAGNFLFDVAHNDDSLRKLFENIKMYNIAKGKKIILFLGILIDKEIDRIARIIYRYRKMFYKIILFDFTAVRPAGSKELYNTLKTKRLKNLFFLNNIKEFKFKNGEEFFYVFTGSFYIMSQLKDFLFV
ncbi:MAG: bifunctional folylpolyglutamate synthase/dihydrofolate synthase [Brevinematia bacterium]